MGRALHQLASETMRGIDENPEGLEGLGRPEVLPNS